MERRAIDDRGEDGEASSFDQEELIGIDAAVASILVTCGVLNSKEFSDESNGARVSTVAEA